jgi:hypothetical protein
MATIPPARPVRAPVNPPLNRFIPPRQPWAGKPAMRTGTGIFLITTGAVLLFALRSGSPHWLNLHIVGVIFILAGTVGLLLPRLARARPGRDRLRRWVRPQAPGGAPAAADPGSNGDRPAPAPDTSVQEDEPTLVDDLLRYEHPLL